MPAKLTNLFLDEVSLVPVGASPHAHIKMFKQDRSLGAQLKSAIAKLRTDDPGTTGHLTDLEILGEITGVVPLEKVGDMRLPKGVAAVSAKFQAEAASANPVKAKKPPTASDPVAKLGHGLETAQELGLQFRKGFKAFKDQLPPMLPTGSFQDDDALGRYLQTETGAALHAAIGKAEVDIRANKDAIGGYIASRVVKERGESETVGPATARLNKLAEAHRASSAKAGKPLSFAKAFVDVVEDPDNVDLFNQSKREDREVNRR